MWRAFNPNPCGRSIGDCAVRAVCAALDVCWDEAYLLLCREGRQQCDMPSADHVWGAVLQTFGFDRKAIPTGYPRGYNAEYFCEDHPEGVYVLAFGGHVATVRDGVLLDSWDSSHEIPTYYYSRRD